MTRKAIPLKIVVDDGALYQSAPKIYPGEVSGPLQRLRAIAVVVLLGLFYVMPWLSWDGRQAVLFDLPARKFHVLGLVLWPQDFMYLAALLAVAGLALFFFTALAGRLWCGYACPQTVWTEVFIAIERLVEGRRNQRMKLDKAPWDGAKVLRKGSKHVLWIALALWTGFTFVGFFTPIRTLGHEVATLTMGGWEAFWLLFYAFATYGNAGWLREQVCTYMCPYARFQNAMLDRDSLVIAYDTKRGEPRGRAKLRDTIGKAGVTRKGGSRSSLLGLSTLGLIFTRPIASAIGARSRSTPIADIPSQSHSRFPPNGSPVGDCVDCSVCVQVCPTGIDIRNGLQYECIGCGACIDGCNGVMEKLGRAPGLIRYTTQNALDGAPTRIVRPRIAIYATLLVAIAGTAAWSLAARVPLLVDVLRDRNALYRVAGDGRTENAYTIRIVNRDVAPHRYRVSVESDAALDVPASLQNVGAAAGTVESVVVTLRAAPDVRGRHDVVIRVVDVEDASVARTERTSFFGPT